MNSAFDLWKRCSFFCVCVSCAQLLLERAKASECRLLLYVMFCVLCFLLKRRVEWHSGKPFFVYLTKSRIERKESNYSTEPGWREEEEGIRGAKRRGRSGEDNTKPQVIAKGLVFFLSFLFIYSPLFAFFFFSLCFRGTNYNLIVWNWTRREGERRTRIIRHGKQLIPRLFSY